MRPLLRPPPAATPTVHPGDPVQPIAHDRPLDPGSAVRQSVPPAGHSALFCPSGVVLLSVVFVDLPWEATPPHFYSVPGTRSGANPFASQDLVRLFRHHRPAECGLGKDRFSDLLGPALF